MPSRDFRLPDLGEGLEDAEVVRWLVSEGDEVSLNQPLVEVDTAKAMVEIPSPIRGRISHLHSDAGDTVLVGAVLVTFEVPESANAPEEPKRKAVLVGYGVDEGSAPTKRRRLRVPAKASPSAPVAVEADEEIGTLGKTLAAPPVRRLAAQLGVDLQQVRGSAPDGRITREDVMAASEKTVSHGSSSAPTTDERIPVKGPRKLIAQKMVRSVTEIPHVTTYLTVDASQVMAAKDALKQHQRETSALAVIARGFIETCRAHPILNSSWSDHEILVRGQLNLGIATDTDRGLIVPVVMDADRMSVEQLAAEITRLASLARDGKASPELLSGGTVTISNVGSFGAEFGTPIINHPEACILALGVIEERALVISGGIQVRPAVTLSLSFDHRIMDGAQAGRALKHMKQLLEDPDWAGAL